MRSRLSLLLVFCIGGTGTPTFAQQPFGGPSAAVASANCRPAGRVGCPGPVARSIANAAADLANSAEPAPRNTSASHIIDLRWDELGRVIEGRTVAVTLTDGSLVRGEAIVVRDDALVVDARGASEAHPYSGPNAAIPRSAVQQVKVHRSAGSSGRTLGTVVGVLTGLVVGGYIAGTAADSAGTGIPLFLGLASGITVVGYHAGKQLDTRVTVIRVVP